MAIEARHDELLIGIVMDNRNVDDMLDRFADGLEPEETVDMIRPQVRDQIQQFALRKGGRQSRWALWLFVGTGASAAAAAFVFMLSPQGVDPSMHVAVAGDAGDLFVRDAETANFEKTFWVGVNVDESCWIHLVERTSNGDLVVVRPQTLSEEYAVRIEGRTRLGPFSTTEPNAPSGPSKVSHVFVIATPTALSGTELASAIPDAVAAGEVGEAVETALKSLRESLRIENDWSIETVRITVMPGE